MNPWAADSNDKMPPIAPINSSQVGGGGPEDQELGVSDLDTQWGQSMPVLKLKFNL